MTTEADRPPEALGVALKEWAGIVAALAGGEQTILLRKGGIDEGPGGFRPEHDWFWLYPTAVHQAQQGLKPGDGEAAPAGDAAATVPLGLFARVDRVERLDDPEVVDRLGPLHAWTDATIHARFRYRKPGLWLMVLRVYALEEPIALAVEPEHAGCRSWVPLAAPCPTRGARPVLDDRRFADARDRVAAALRPGPT
jgi:hypothetical protein